MSFSMHDTSYSLLTDLYQLTMAYGYWKTGKAEEQAVFNLYFRKHPFHGGFTIACGLNSVIRFLEGYRLTGSDLAYLRELKGADGKELFEEAFLVHLQQMKFTCDVDAVPEGTVVFPNEPLLRITGPILQCQLLETPLLNLINFETLIATKAARIRLVAKTDSLLEFGLRRAQGPDGGLTASRAAFIGGFDATSNVLAGKRYGIPVKGTHAHSWVMSFASELEAFEAYARVLPNNVTLLVDTYDSLEGVRQAIQVGAQLRAKGYDLQAIRLDSGDLAYLSIESRKILDEAGFEHTAIVASNDLDENIILSLKQQGAKITVWGVGTKLVTAFDQPALGGVYKLAALRSRTGEWMYKLKLSEQPIKVSTPGIQQVRRYYNDEGFAADMIFNIETPPAAEAQMIDPYDFTKQRTFPADWKWVDLLVPVFRRGAVVFEMPAIVATREKVQQELGQLHEGIKRFVHPHVYPVGLEKQLFELKTRLILEHRKEGG